MNDTRDVELNAIGVLKRREIEGSKRGYWRRWSRL